MVSENLSQILIASGGAFVVCAAIFASLWKLAMDATLEKFKCSQAEAIERLKIDLAQSIARAARLEDAQFGAYREIFEVLSDLRLSADRLWDLVTQRNVNEFGRHLEAVRKMLYGKELILPQPQLGKLQELINQFEEFYKGKQGLLEIYESNRSSDSDSIARLIAHNKSVRDEFNVTVTELKHIIGNQIGNP